MGLDNYANLFTDPDLFGSIVNAFELIVFFSFIPVLLGLLIAATIRQIAAEPPRHGGPHGAVPAAGHPAGRGRHHLELAALDHGMVNQFLRAVGLGSVTRAWLGDFDSALPAVGLIGAWVLIGLCTLLLLAGMTQDRRRALRGGPARWGRAGAGVLLDHPAVLRQEIGVCVTVTVIAALASFDVIYISTQGGPGNATMVPGLEIYHLAFVERQVGPASALAVVTDVLVLASVLPIQRLTERD